MSSGHAGRVPISLEPHELHTNRLPTAGTAWPGPSFVRSIASDTTLTGTLAYRMGGAVTVNGPGALINAGTNLLTTGDTIAADFTNTGTLTVRPGTTTMSGGIAILSLKAKRCSCGSLRRKNTAITLGWTRGSNSSRRDTPLA